MQSSVDSVGTPNEECITHQQSSEILKTGPGDRSDEATIMRASEIQLQDNEKALEIIRELALTGNTEAQYLYAFWSGNSFNLESFICLKKAAEKGHKKACRLISLSYCTNSIMAHTFRPNFDLFLDFLVQSVESDTKRRTLKHVLSLPGVNIQDEEVISILSFVKNSDASPEKYCNCLRWFAELIFQGFVTVRNDLKGELLELYHHGVKTKSKNAGEAAFGLGILHLIEFFGTEFKTKCFNLFKSSLFAEYSKTAPYMALCYFRGIGTPTDIKTGTVHLEKCIDNPAIIKSFVKAFTKRGDLTSISSLERHCPPTLAKYFRR